MSTPWFVFRNSNDGTTKRQNRLFWSFTVWEPGTGGHDVGKRSSRSRFSTQRDGHSAELASTTKEPWRQKGHYRIPKAVWRGRGWLQRPHTGTENRKDCDHGRHRPATQTPTPTKSSANSWAFFQFRLRIWARGAPTRQGSRLASSENSNFCRIPLAPWAKRRPTNACLNFIHLDTHNRSQDTLWDSKLPLSFVRACLNISPRWHSEHRNTSHFGDKNNWHHRRNNIHTHKGRLVVHVRSAIYTVPKKTISVIVHNLHRKRYISITVLIMQRPIHYRKIRKLQISIIRKN